VPGSNLERRTPSRSLRILLLEPDLTGGLMLAELLRQAGHGATVLTNGVDAMEHLRAAQYDAVITEVSLPGIDGLTLLERLKDHSPDTAVIITSGRGTINEAVRAMKARATHYLAKPVELEELFCVLAQLAEDRDIRERLATGGASDDEPRLLGETPAVLRLKQSLSVIATSSASVLVTGENGTGKELVARIIHERGPRAAMPFVAVSCAALMPERLDAELFGTGGGTGDSPRARDGHFRAADGGTLFLDDVGDMSLATQARLLRALEDCGREPSSSPASLPPSNVRIIAATSADLPARVEAGSFRVDLYYKLKVLQLRVPALRDRRGDLPLLVQSFYESARGVPGERFPGSPRVWAALEQYAFPGNVRELKHAVEHAVVHAQGGPIDLEHLPEELGGPHAVPSGPSSTSLPAAVREFEREYLTRTLHRASGQKQRAAEMLGISRKTLWVKIKQYGITGFDGED
jgi:DNA-binding NtrC family response regulator